VEHLAFYSHKESTVAKPKRKAISPQRLFRRSKHKYSGPTHDQLIAESEKISRPEPQIKRAPSVRISRRIKVPSDSISESTGVLNLPNTPNGQASGEITPNSAASELKRFETSVFPSPPPDESVTSFDMTDTGSPSTVNHVGHHDVSPPNEVVTKRPPPSHVEVENYGFKMFIFIMFILALIMIPIAIVWETRKTYIKSTDAYKGLAKWVFRSFGYKI